MVVLRQTDGIERSELLSPQVGYHIWHWDEALVTADHTALRRFIARSLDRRC
jgi:hypothetical protein